MFLDEPIAGLDPLGRKEIRDIILKIKEEGRTVFFCSHILQDAELMCDWVGILCRGKLVKTGKLDELLKTEKTEIFVDRVDEEGLALLEKRPCRIIKEGGKVTISVNNEDLVEEIEGVIRAHGGRHLSIVPYKESLEEFFLKEVE